MFWSQDMKCSNCGSQWHTGQDTSIPDYCPFCGMSLIRKELPAENLTLSVVLQQIIEKFGKQILLDTRKCVAVFKDMAPTLKEEQRLLEIALKMDVGMFFTNAQSDELEAAIKKSMSAMDGILADEAIESILSAFVTALNWDASLLDDLLATKRVSLQVSNESISQYQFDVNENVMKEKTEGSYFNNKNLREEEIKAATEATLKKANALKEKAYVAAGVASNLASVVFKKASEKVAEKSNQTVSKSEDTWQPYESKTLSQTATGYPDEETAPNKTTTVIDGVTSFAEDSVQEASFSATEQNIRNLGSNSASVSQNGSATSVANSNVTLPSSSGSVISNNGQPQKSSNKMKMGLVAATVLILGGYGLYAMTNTEHNISKLSKPDTPYVAQQKQGVIQQPIASQKSSLDLTKDYLTSLGYSREAPYVKATTYGHSSDGFLFYQFQLIWIYDIKRNRMACLFNTPEVIGNYKLCRNDNLPRPLYLKLAIGKDERDKDANIGAWDDKQTHIIPVYVLYEFKPDGTMQDKGLYSGIGKNPSHYHSYLYEQKNVDMVNILLKQLAYFDKTVFDDFPMAKESSVAKSSLNSSSMTAANNSTEARNTFISFHKAITDKRLGDAYNILSPDYQKFMRNYDNFARGYATTLRSDIVELNTLHEDSSSASYAYKLKAVDRDGTGTKTQYFAGKVKLIKLNGIWRIDNTEAKRL